MARHRVSLVRGRFRVPFQGYLRRRAASQRYDDAQDDSYPSGIFGRDHGLTPVQAGQAQRLLARAVRERGHLRGPRFASRIAGIVSAVKHERVGNSGWGWSMHGKRGGQLMARHALYKLREISPKGVRASVVARERREAREASSGTALLPRRHS
jgi:hypothetical protein